MANNIKGITIEIGGDTTGLEESLKDVNKRAKDVQEELKEVQKALKLDPGNVELVRQKQDLLTRSIAETSTKLGALKQAQAQVEQQFRSNKITEEQYRAFQRELQSTEAELRRFETQLQSVGAEQDKLARNQKDLQTYLNATGKTVDDLASVLGTRLTNAIKDGSASGDQLEMALNRIARQAGHSGQELEEFRRTLRNVDSGSNLDQIRQDLERLSQSADQAQGNVKGLGSELGALAGGLAAGGGIGGAVNAALDMAGLETKIKISMDVPEESIGTIKEAIKGVTKYGVDAEEALEAVRRQWALNGDATDAMNTKIIQGAGAITKAFQGVDMIELVQETNEIAAALKITNEDALALTNSLLKTGFPPEQLDTIAEYGMQMKNAGFSANEIQQIFEKGVDTKSWNIDNLNDGVKEARITMSEFGLEVDENMGLLLEKAGMSSTQFQAWGKAVADGGSQGSKAMSEMVTWLDGIQDSTLKNELGIKAFGTKWEDQGQNLISVFQGLDKAQNQTAENQGKLNNLVEGLNEDPAVKLQEAMNNMMVALAPLLMKVAEIVTKLADWAADNPKLTATLVAIGTIVGVIAGAFLFLAPIVTAIAGMFTAGGIAAGFFGGALAILTSPITLIIAAIVALIAIGVLLYKNWDTIKEYLLVAWEGIKSAAETVWNAITAYFKWALNLYLTIFTTIWNAICAVTVSVWNAIKTAIMTPINLVKSGIEAAVGFIKQHLSFSGLSSTVSGIFETIKGYMVNPIQKAKDLISKIVDGIKGFFSNLSLKIPDIKLPKLPKFSMEGKFSLTPPSVPKLKVKWNALGGIFSKPTIFNTANAGLQGVGEAGPEAILPLNAQTLASIGKGIAEQMGGMSGQEIVVPVTLQIDGHTFAQYTAKHYSKAQYNENNIAQRGRV